MWLIDKIKNLFGKQIKLDERQKENLISFANIKNNCLVFGSEINVDSGFCLCFVFFNHLCDILGEGKYVIEQNIVPKLWRKYIGTLKETSDKTINKIENVDVYFVNVDKTFELEYKTFKFISFYQQAKVKTRLQGKISFKIKNVEEFMKFFSDEFAVLKNDKILTELKDIFVDEITMSLDKGNVQLEDLILDKNKMETFVKDKLTILGFKYGVEIENVEIDDVILSKRDIGKKLIVENKLKNQEEMIKFAENSINGVTQEQGTSVVYSQNIEEKSVEENNVNSNINVNAINEYSKDLNSQESDNKRENNSCDCGQINLGYNNEFHEKINKKYNVDEVMENLNKNMDKVTYFTDTYGFGNTPQQAPKIFNEDEDKQQESNTNKILSQNININSNDNKDLTQNDCEENDGDKSCLGESQVKKDLITCSCCGAKNFANQTICCVCKSKL